MYNCDIITANMRSMY